MLVRTVPTQFKTCIYREHGEDLCKHVMCFRFSSIWKSARSPHRAEQRNCVRCPPSESVVWLDNYSKDCFCFCSDKDCFRGCHLCFMKRQFSSSKDHNVGPNTSTKVIMVHYIWPKKMVLKCIYPPHLMLAETWYAENETHEKYRVCWR